MQRDDEQSIPPEALKPLVRKFMSGKSEKEIEEAAERLKRYLEVALRITERLAAEEKHLEEDEKGAA